MMLSLLLSPAISTPAGLLWQSLFASAQTRNWMVAMKRSHDLSRPWQPHLAENDVAGGFAPNFQAATFDQGTHASRQKRIVNLIDIVLPVGDRYPAEDHRYFLPLVRHIRHQQRIEK